MNSSLPEKSGHSLVEVLTVLGVISIVAASGALALRKTTGWETKLRTGGRLVVAALAEARREAIALQTPCRLLFVEYPNSRSGRLLPAIWGANGEGHRLGAAPEIELPAGIHFLNREGIESGAPGDFNALLAPPFDRTEDSPTPEFRGAVWYVEFDSHGNPMAPDGRIEIGLSSSQGREIPRLSIGFGAGGGVSVE